MLAPGEERDFLEARPGDHLFCPFECDSCSFHRLRGAPPDPARGQDVNLLAYIRRANLDAFWSRRPGTVRGLLRLFVEQVAVGEEFGFEMFEPPGFFSEGYCSGMKAAVGVLARSQKAGRHEEKQKFSSAWKARTVHTNVYEASARIVEKSLVWRSERSRFVATDSPTESSWFCAMMVGFKVRVGEQRRQDAAISIHVMLAKQELLEQEWTAATEARDSALQREVAENGAFFLFLYCASLRGFEGPKVMLTELRSQIVAPGSAASARVTPHVGLPLSGRFKARSQEQQSILIPIAFRTASGLEPGVWALRLIESLRRCGVTGGWAFQNRNGSQRSMSSFEEKFIELLQRVQEADPSLFPGAVVIVEDFHLGRSHRRGATSRATAAGVAGTDIDWINWWNIGIDSSGSGPMRVLYTERTQQMETFIRFSAAL
jgi:hypothetical protein